MAKDVYRVIFMETFDFIYSGSLIQLGLYPVVALAKKKPFASTRIHLGSTIIYILVGLLFTLWSMYHTDENTTCGSYIFNGISIISILGNLLNLIIFGISSLYFRLLKSITKYYLTLARNQA